MHATPTSSPGRLRDDPPARPTGGRPRDPSRDTAIHRAALGLLREVGYDALSLGAVAIRAGVSKATIYRRWPNKAAVVASALEHQAPSVPPEPRGPDLRADLLEVLGWLAHQIAGQDMATLAAVIAGMRSDPDLARAMRGRLHRDEAAMLERSLRRAADRAEMLHPQADTLFAEVAPAMIVHRLLIVGADCDAPFLEHLVDDVVMPLLRGPGTPPARV